MNSRKAKKCEFDYTLFLASVLSMCNVVGVARLKDIITGLSEQSARYHRELGITNDELVRLRESVKRFRMLEEAVKVKEERLRIGIALLLNVPLKVDVTRDAYAEYLRSGMPQEAGVLIGAEDLHLLNVPLWKVIREILRQTSEIRVFELESHLKSFGLNAARSAIESALATHRKEFKITRQGREKYVSLK